MIRPIEDIPAIFTDYDPAEYYEYDTSMCCVRAMCNDKNKCEIVFMLYHGDWWEWRNAIGIGLLDEANSLVEDKLIANHVMNLY